MFQELPHIYVEPDELKKAIQSTGTNVLFFSVQKYFLILQNIAK